MSMLDELLKKRSSFKGQLTKFENYISIYNDITNVSNVQILEIKLRITRMEAVFSHFDEVQTSLECMPGADESAQQIARSEFESKYFSIMARAQELCSDFKRSSKQKSRRDSNSSSSSVESDKQMQNMKGVRLPTINLMKFKGEPENWLEFRDTYNSLVHFNKTLSSIQKFHYLRASMEGNAAQIIHSLQFSDANYTVAWNLLCERYDNKRLLIQTHIKAIFNAEPIRKESSSAIRNLLDSYLRNLRVLTTLGEPTDSWDTLIIYIISNKLDSSTLREWETKRATDATFSLNCFSTFLRNRADLLETIEYANKPEPTIPRQTIPTRQVRTMSTSIQARSKLMQCPLCKSEHALYKCDKFLQMSVNQRQGTVRNLNLCTNCLRSGHHMNSCKMGSCRRCYLKHNTLLHDSQENTTKENRMLSPTTENQNGSPHATVLSVNLNRTHSLGNNLIGTAILRMFDSQGKTVYVKAILDSASQISIMSSKLQNRLGLPLCNVNFGISFCDNFTSSSSNYCTALIQSIHNTFQCKISFLILNSINCINNEYFSELKSLKIPSEYELADPRFYENSTINLLIGSDIFWEIIGSQQLLLSENGPFLRETKLGYIVVGPFNNTKDSNALPRLVSCNTQSTNTTQFCEIQEQLARFFTIEDIPGAHSPRLSTEERLCEEHYTKHVSRTDSGRFSVAIPLKQDESTLGDSFHCAKKCFFSLERKFQKQTEFKAMYVKFMAEYLSLGHMSLSNINNYSKNSFFLPHHGVWRENHPTTPLRTVFNGSKRTNPDESGPSLNDLQMVGPTIQSDLISIILRFRQHRFVMAADIEKMYRQILVNKDQRHLQQIIWRDDPSKELQSYFLNTVTYGTSSAAFLAVRCLKQLADECPDPLVRMVINEDFYVDDLLTGQDTAEGLLNVRDKITQVLLSGAFNLRKFRSNLPECNDSGISSLVDIGENEQCSTLGIKWSASSDTLHFNVKVNTDSNPTKRSILSYISQIFDPLGLLGVFVIVGKVILQKLWLHKLEWDDPLPPDVITVWKRFVCELTQINDLSFPRSVVCENPIEIQCHIFSDASLTSYGACIFIRSKSATGKIEVNLLCSKSRVAPLKVVTIPRLELCGALLGAKLMKKVLSITRLKIDQCVFWCDAKVVLSWIKMAPSRLKPFVRNRVSEIQELTSYHSFYYVPTSENPADMLTRSFDSSSADKMALWMHGPQFLMSDESLWPNEIHQEDSNLPELVVSLATANESERTLFPFERFSKFTKIRNTMAFVLRFIHNCQSKLNNASRQGPLTYAEKQASMRMLLQISQRESFSEYEDLRQGKQLHSKNSLLSLNPFFHDSLILVGGRLHNSEYSFEKKHPILLNAKHSLTKLIFENEHLRLMHAGPQLLLASIREQYWPIGGRNLGKQTVHKCIRCFRFRSQTVKPIMGNLPEQRFQSGYPFQVTGIDYAGPITVLNKRGRGSRTEKAYIAVFVCFSTKAIHLELVSSLTKEAFLCTLRRFIARRSKPHTIFSDNGTQFHGAHNEIRNFFKNANASIRSEMSDEGIDFKFIPPYAAHQGGLWESGVKMTKFHLSRVLKDAHLVFEDLYTVLVEIEAILNSRPVTPISTDPLDMTALTPGHFLVGRPLTALPTTPLDGKKPSQLTHYARLEQLRQHFWKRWHKEYIAELQQRTKWRTSKGTLQENTLVVIKEDNLPPMKWSLGRITKVFKGTDGINRVADIKTSKGTIRRAFNRICPLPLNN